MPQHGELHRQHIALFAARIVSEKASAGELAAHLESNASVRAGD
jgi:hypothetical protein